MNPGDNPQSFNTGVNPGVPSGQTTSPQGFTVQGTVTPSVTPSPVQPMPAQSVPVTPTPMPAQGTPVAPTPMPATPQTVAPVQVGSEQTKEDPNARLTEVNIPPSVPTATAEPQVINTTKSKGSNILLFIVIIILIIFAVNIDKMSEMYDNYMKTGSLTSNNVNPDNTSSGFIKIDDATSSMKVKNIKFYNFKKSTEDLTLTFSFEAFEKIEDPAKLNIYVEIYNSEKEMLYRSLFDPQNQIEMNSTSSYTMVLESDIHSDAYYAFVKVYTGTDLSAQSTLTCKYSDTSYNYENKYYFVGNSLTKYDVTKTSIKEDDTTLETEYESLKNTTNAVFNNQSLTYTIDLEKTNIVTPIYPKGLTKAVVKNRETLKEWKCE